MSGLVGNTEDRFSHNEAQIPVSEKINSCPENNNFATFIPRNFKFCTFSSLHTTKNCRNFQLDILSGLGDIDTQKYNKHIAKYENVPRGGGLQMSNVLILLPIGLLYRFMHRVPIFNQDL